jgi:hypothetical protein
LSTLLKLDPDLAKILRFVSFDQDTITEKEDFLYAQMMKAFFGSSHPNL